MSWRRTFLSNFTSQHRVESLQELSPKITEDISKVAEAFFVSFASTAEAAEATLRASWHLNATLVPPKERGGEGKVKRIPRGGQASVHLK